MAAGAIIDDETAYGERERAEEQRIFLLGKRGRGGGLRLSQEAGVIAVADVADVVLACDDDAFGGRWRCVCVCVCVCVCGARAFFLLWRRRLLAALSSSAADRFNREALSHETRFSLLSRRSV